MQTDNPMNPSSPIMPDPAIRSDGVINTISIDPPSGAREMHNWIQNFSTLPDHLQMAITLVFDVQQHWRGTRVSGPPTISQSYLHRLASDVKKLDSYFAYGITLSLAQHIQQKQACWFENIINAISGFVQAVESHIRQVVKKEHPDKSWWRDLTVEVLIGMPTGLIGHTDEMREKFIAAIGRTGASTVQSANTQTV